MTADERWMRRALALAARGFTPPNPLVGCVLVAGDRAVAEGWHTMAGEPHAEAAALARAGDAARGTTAYVTLEPCSHFGRTPPCADALIGAGVSRVVAAIEDPNPAVSGRGLERLRRAGIAVDVGTCAEAATRLNRAFLHFHATHSPFVTLKAAVSIDGKTAAHTGDSRWITNEKSRELVHRLRGQSGAVLCGIGTALADDPELTCRLPGVPRQPTRVVVDPMARLPLGSRLVTGIAEAPVVVAVGQGAPAERLSTLVEHGVQVVRVPSDAEGKLDLAMLLGELASSGIISVLVEGGGATHAEFVRQGCWHRALWFVAPKFIGGRDAPTSLEGSGVERVADAPGAVLERVRRIGGDCLLEYRRK